MPLIKHDEERRRRMFPPNFPLISAPQGTSLQAAYMPVLYQESVVKDATNAVSMVLDVKGGGVQYGSELLTNGNFSQWSGDNPVGWSVGGGENATNYVTESNGACRIVSDGAYIGIQQSIATIGKTYKVTINVLSITGTIVVTYSVGTGVQYEIAKISTPGVHTFYALATANIFEVKRSTACDVTFDNVSLVEIPGNHIMQFTQANKPLWQSDGSIYHDGTSDFLKSLNWITFGQPCSIVLIGKQNSWTAFDNIYDGYTSYSMALYQSVASPNLRSYLGSGTSMDNGNALLGKYYIITEIFNGANSSIYVNDTKTSGGIASVNGGGFTLGARGDNTAFGNITWKAILIYNGSLPDWYIPQLNKWALDNLGVQP
jgi:hypothetical protein